MRDRYINRRAHELAQGNRQKYHQLQCDLWRIWSCDVDETLDVLTLSAEEIAAMIHRMDHPWEPM